MYRKELLDNNDIGIKTLSDQALFYKKIVPLNEERYAKYSLDRAQDYSYAADTNAVYISLAEFPKVAREYPVVFAGKENQLSPVALLGLENNKNLFIDKHGQWNADYIPAYVRRYPFILAQSGKEFTVCLDESYKGLNQEGKGEKLFESDGQRSAYLERTLGFLNQYQADHNRTQAFVNKLKELDLLEPMHANVELNSGVKVSLAGFFVVKRERLKALDMDRISELLKSDALEQIYTHLVSMENFHKLMERFAKFDKEN